MPDPEYNLDYRLVVTLIDDSTLTIDLISYEDAEIKLADFQENGGYLHENSDSTWSFHPKHQVVSMALELAD